MRLLIITILSFNLTSLANAQTQSLEYNGFYQRLKQYHKNDYQLVELTFSVPRQDNCRLISANISNNNQIYPLPYDESQRLYLPYDEELKANRALINLDFKNDAINCAIAIQIRTKQGEYQYSSKELKSIYDEINTLSKNMQGFPLKYFADDVDGLMFNFPNDSKLYIDGKYIRETVNKKIQLTKKELINLANISFSEKPTFVSSLKI